jgi:hypothetical protein
VRIRRAPGRCGRAPTVSLSGLDLFEPLRKRERRSRTAGQLWSRFPLQAPPSERFRTFYRSDARPGGSREIPYERDEGPDEFTSKRKIFKRPTACRPFFFGLSGSPRKTPGIARSMHICDSYLCLDFVLHSFLRPVQTARRLILQRRRMASFALGRSSSREGASTMRQHLSPTQNARRFVPTLLSWKRASARRC